MDDELALRSFDGSKRNLVERRIAFLLQEARHGSPRDHAVTFTMRAISNYLTIGRDAQSFAIKSVNKNVSSGALELLKSATNFKDWAKNTINEHPVPLADTWTWLCSQAGNLSLAEVWNRFESNPMTTVTKEEDDELTKRKLRSSAADDRYPQAGFRTLVLKHTPLSAFEGRDFSTD
jgi:hypothetical protein